MRSKSIKSLLSICLILLLTNQEVFANLSVENAWIRSAPTGSIKYSGYMSFENDSSTSLLISNIKSNAFQKVEIHESLIQNNVSKMREVNEINISPKSTLELKPGQLHLMLMNPIKEIKENEPIELMIYFKKDMNAEILRIEATVLRNGYE